MDALEITAHRTAPRATTLEIRYHTPEWGRTVASFGTALMVSAWLVATILISAAARHGLIPLPGGKVTVVVAILSAAVFWLAWTTNGIAQDRQKKKGITATLRLTIDPEGLTREDAGDPLQIKRDGEFLFTTQAHRGGRCEEREERRVGHPQGYAFRDAWEVWLQAGHRIERLASVADEASARAMVRHLQNADQIATRGQQQHDAMTKRTAPA